ncbi:flavodoxin domain-containing protein [Proteiniclasticum sp.]|uniref:flavodoxin domain-containing protein n=1 Tax=Proteiniclasticum sp. TaxID=2053595 RepID=UPI0028A0A4D2|nr:flavodoxin domain-containing protein [Proteiniclasticum sp.]
MKVLIIYSSHYKGNTEKIAERFSEKADCDLINIKDNGPIHTEKYDLIGFGSGVYKESTAPRLVKIISQLELEGKPVFVFSTSGVGIKSYNRSLIHALEMKGAKVRGSFSCKGSFVAKEFTDVRIFALMSRLAKGHPNNRDYKEAEKFMMNMVQSV